MNNFIEKLIKLHITELRYKGINHQTFVILNIQEIKDMLGYSRLSVDNFMKEPKELLEKFNIKITKMDNEYIQFKLDRFTKISSFNLIELYQDALNYLKSEADSTGDYSKLT